MPLAQLLFALGRGIAPDELCRSAGFALHDLADRDSFVPYSWYLALWQALVRHCPDIPVGIEFGKFLTFDQMGSVGQAFRHSRTGLEALRKCCRLAALFDSHAASYPLEIELREHSIEVRVARELTAVAPECVEAVAFSMVTQLASACGERIRMLEARFHIVREPLRAQYEQFFGCQVRFGCDEDALVFDRAQLEAPIAGASAAVSERVDAYVARAFARADDPREAFAAAVECAVRAQLQQGELSELQTAAALGMSRRSFQRKLRENGRTYSQIVDTTRRAQALRLAADPKLAIYEIAFSLGYQDVSSFNRAFKRWTGSNPRTYRESRSGQASAGR